MKTIYDDPRFVETLAALAGDDEQPEPHFEANPDPVVRDLLAEADQFAMPMPAFRSEAGLSTCYFKFRTLDHERRKRLVDGLLSLGVDALAHVARAMRPEDQSRFYSVVVTAMSSLALARPNPTPAEGRERAKLLGAVAKTFRLGRNEVSLDVRRLCILRAAATRKAVRLAEQERAQRREGERRLNDDEVDRLKAEGGADALGGFTEEDFTRPRQENT